MGWDKERLTELTLKYITGELTVEEQAELEEWLKADPINRERFEARVSEEGISEGLAVWQAGHESKVSALDRMDWGRPKPMWRRMAVVAAVLIVFSSVGILFLLNGRGKTLAEPTTRVVSDLPPGGNKAVLTLANGSSIILDSSSTGLIARQGHSAVVIKGKGQLIYKEANAAADVGYNVVATPRGGEYQVVLPDGTKVWLNAASSIRFPTVFTGPNRDVEFTGEAYFEVKHSITMPFRVHARGQVIEDIGTHFNVNAYADEPTMKTTLEEGSVRLGELTLSKSGEQVAFDPMTGKISLNRQVDLEQVLAWKEGLIEFKDADLETVLRTLGRWYDFEVTYKTNKDTTHLFTGQFSKVVSLNGNLMILEETGYHLQLVGKTLEVLP